MSSVMRLVSFFVMSLSLHAAIVVYPVSLDGHREVEFVQVTLVPIERAGGGGSDKGANENATRRGKSKFHHPMPPVAAQRVQPKSPRDLERQDVPAQPVPTVSDDGTAQVSSVTNAPKIAAAISEPAQIAPNGSGNGLGASGGNDGFGSSFGGPGQGGGNGDGSGSSGSGMTLTQARYRDTPKPHYPESARRDGREGRVLLRVLVDDQGRVEQVEINASSGSDALDRAAADAIKRWRFYPARYGDRPVESWIKVPVEFALTNAAG